MRARTRRCRIETYDSALAKLSLWLASRREHEPWQNKATPCTSSAAIPEPRPVRKYFARAILVPIALAILLSFVLAPLADRIERWHCGRIPAVAFVVATTIVVVGSVGWSVTRQAVQLGEKLPDYQDNLFAKIRDLRQ